MNYRGSLGLGLAGSLAALVACGGGDRDNNQTGSSFTGPSGGSNGSSGTDTAGTASTGGMKLDTPGGNETGNSTGSCNSIDEMAMNEQQPADIVFVLDNSGSMETERTFLELVMNSFSSQIVASGIDAHVVIISSYPGNDGVCIDPPLGSGGCPTADNNPPTFVHVDFDVGSTNQFDTLIQQWPNYEAVIRPEAQLHLVVVSDDGDDLSASQFQTQFNALDPARTQGYIFHAISPSVNLVTCLILKPACCNPLILGSTDFDPLNYINHTVDTGGVFGDLCDLQAGFQPVFDELSTSVQQNSTLNCAWDIPDPPDGLVFDADQVNVSFDDGMGGVLTFGRVDSAAECMNVTDGWYYDDPANPTRIMVCPQTCTKIQGAAMASISIQFGCDTIPAG